MCGWFVGGEWDIRRCELERPATRRHVCPYPRGNCVCVFVCLCELFGVLLFVRKCMFPIHIPRAQRIRPFGVNRYSAGMLVGGRIVGMGNRYWVQRYRTCVSTRKCRNDCGRPGGGGGAPDISIQQLDLAERALSVRKLVICTHAFYWQIRPNAVSQCEIDFDYN